MSVSNQNLFFSRGDTYVLSVLAQDYLQNVINLTGVVSIKCTAKRTASDTAQLFQKTVGSGVTVVSAPAGTFTVTIAPADTLALPQYNQTLVYDVVVTAASGAITSVLSGSIYLAADVTP